LGTADVVVGGEVKSNLCSERLRQRWRRASMSAFFFPWKFTPPGLRLRSKLFVVQPVPLVLERDGPADVGGPDLEKKSNEGVEFVVRFLHALRSVALASGGDNPRVPE
jgi:hypothetical protein